MGLTLFPSDTVIVWTGGKSRYGKEVSIYLKYKYTIANTVLELNTVLLNFEWVKTLLLELTCICYRTLTRVTEPVT